LWKYRALQEEELEMGKEQAEVHVKAGADKAADASPKESHHAADLSQAAWGKDQAIANKPASERSADENQRLHDIGAKEIDDIFKEFKQQEAKNPYPSTWKYDDKGHLLEAGERVSAQYDDKGNLTKARIDDRNYEKVGNDVVETFPDRDGKPFSYTTKNVQDFTLKTVDGNLHGPYKSVDLEFKTANGSGGAELAKIWESPEHSQFVSDVWSGKYNEKK
jgi:hypothetical protein